MAGGDLQLIPHVKKAEAAAAQGSDKTHTSEENRQGLGSVLCLCSLR